MALRAPVKRSSSAGTRRKSTELLSESRLSFSGMNFVRPVYPQPRRLG